MPSNHTAPPSVIGGYIRLLGLALAFGVATGLGLWLISQVICLVFISPLLSGALAGAFLAQTARKAHVNNFNLTLAVATAMAGVLYLSYHAANALYAHLFSLTPVASIPAYLTWATHQPTVIARGISLVLTQPLPPGFVWFYWLFELGTIGLTASALVKSTPETPMCPLCRSWYSGIHIGSIADYDLPSVHAHLEEWNLRCVALLIAPTLADDHALDVYLLACTCGRSQAILSASVTFMGAFGRPQQKDVLHVIMRAHEAHRFKNLAQTHQESLQW